MEAVPHIPPPALRPYVAGALGYRMPALPGAVHRGLPSRFLTLVIDLDAPLEVRWPAGAIASHGVVGGLHTTPALIEADREQVGLEYALSPMACRGILGVPAGAIGGLSLDLAEIFGAEAARLVDRVACAATWRERFHLVDSVLLARLDDAVPPDPLVEAVWALTFGLGGRLPVAEIADRVGYTRRHLTERFRVATGVTPKQAARVARFEHARQVLSRPERPAPARVAVSCGYADQSHLCREWRALAGCTLTSWLHDELPFIQDGASLGTTSSSA